MQPRLHGRDRYCESLCGLLGAEVLDLAKHEHRSEFAGKIGNRTFDQQPQLFACDGRVRLRLGRRLREPFAIGIEYLDSIGLEPAPPAPLGPQARQRLVDDDSRQPGAER